MEGANKNQTPKKGGFPAPKNSIFGVKESNENECNKLLNPKKPMAKNFMSPTISAASKVSTPRKKILGERNGIPPFSDASSLKSPNLGPRKEISGQLSPMISSYSFASESDDEEKSSITAYDPASSYLSPRPKYLRYNPNRKRDVLLQLASMGVEGGDGFSSEESDFQNVEVEVEEEFEEEDDLQNVEEESKKNQCLDVNRSAVPDSEDDTFQKVVEDAEESDRSAVFDSENTTLQNVEEEVEESKINQVLDVNRSEVFGSENSICEGVVKMHNDKDELEENDDEEVEDLDEETQQYEEFHGWSLKGILKFLVVLSMFVLAALFAFSMYSTVLNSEEVTAGPKDHYSSLQDYIAEDVSMSMLKDGYGISIIEADMDEPIVNMLEDATVEELTDSNGISMVEADMVKSESIDWTIDEPVVNMLKDATVTELSDSHAKGSNSYGNEEAKAQLPELSVEVDIVESEPVDDMLEDATVAELTNSHAQESDSDANDEVPMSRKVDNMSEDATLAELIRSHAQESNSYANDEVPMSIVEESVDIVAGEIRLLQLKNKMVVAISALFSIISGSLVFIFLSKERQASKVSPISIEKLDSTEEPCPVTPTAEEKKIENQVHPSAASSLFNSSEEAAQEFSRIRSPTVQLLGEFVVREVQRSLRRCDQKVDNELCESEESNNVLERKKKKAVFQISSPPKALASPEYSIADSASCYGSFTTEAKILKKENGKDAEFTTPVRRSSRIRSRSGDPSQ